MDKNFLKGKLIKKLEEENSSNLKGKLLENLKNEKVEPFSEEHILKSTFINRDTGEEHKATRIFENPSTKRKSIRIERIGKPEVINLPFDDFRTKLMTEGSAWKIKE
jgi:hypothetical protein